MVLEPTPESEAFGWAEAESALSRALRFGINPSLDGIRKLTEALGRPQDTFASVQVTGTNGKSSVVRMTSAILAAHGWRVGTYTSPHLRSYAERVDVTGVHTSEPFAQAIGMAVLTAESEGLELTEFEILTGAALWLFARVGVQVAVLEVGLGGRWDATSVVDPAVAVVTGIGLDHTDRLGDTVEEIAGDKAHIIKPACVAVLGPGVPDELVPVFADRADSLGVYTRVVRGPGESSPVADDLTICYDLRECPTSPTGDTRLDVRGIHAGYPDITLHAPSYQAPNAATAVAAAEATIGSELDAPATRRAFDQLRIPGRFDVIDSGAPVIVADGAHNPQAAGVLAQAIAEAWPHAGRRPVVVLGMLADKDAAGVVAALAPVVAGFVVTAPLTERALPATRLAEVVDAATGARPREFVSVAQAVHAAREMSEDGVVVTGSLYTVGEAIAAR